jgi:hypothetical protein
VSTPTPPDFARGRRRRPLYHSLAVLDEDLFGAPVLGFPLQPVAALEQQDALARGSQVTGQRATAGAAADDDVIVSIAYEIGLHH